MEPEELRFRILLMLDQHEATGSAAYLGDKSIAEKLGVSVKDVQRQLDIMENRKQVTVVRAFGPSYAAEITPSGMEMLELARAQQRQPPRKPIGF